MKRVAVKAWIVVLLGIMLTACAGSPEARRDKFLARGKAFLDKRDFARATLEFSNASKAMPRDAEPYYYAGMAAMESGDYQRAYHAFLKTLELDPKHVAARLRIAQLKLGANQEIVKDSEKELSDLIESGTPTAEMMNTLAAAELKLGKPDDAVQILEETLAKSPGELVSSLLLARAKLVQKDVRGAEEVLRKATEASPKAVAPQLILARFYVALQKDAEAEQGIRHAIQLDPENMVAVRELALLQNRTGRKKEAEENFKKLSMSGQENFKSLYALFLYTEGRRDEAVRELERLMKENPGDRLIRSRLVGVYEAVNRPADARRVLDEALKKNPKDLEARLQRAQILTAERKYTDAEADLNLVVGQKPDLPAGLYAMAKVHQGQQRELQYRQDLYKTLQLAPLWVGVREELAGELINNNFAKDALAVLDQTPNPQKNLPAILGQRNWALWALGKFPEMRKGIDEGLAQVRAPGFLVQDGLWKLQAGNPTGARASLEEALHINPEDIRGLSALRDTYLKQRQGAMAVQKVKEYAMRQPKSAPMQEILGFTLWGSGDRAGARSAFTAAKAADPKYERADLELAQLDALDSNWDAVAARLNGLLNSNPGDTTAHLWLGNVEVLRHNPAAAIEHFRKVVEAAPDNAMALNNLAYLLTEQKSEQKNNLDEALKYAERAQELAPDEPLYAGTLGWILYCKGLYPSAVKYLERAVASKDAVPKYHLAMAYAKNGDLAHGRSMFQAALKGNPNLPEAKIVEREFFQSK